jgi:LPXTG-motif cell wall-anchored protein
LVVRGDVPVDGPGPDQLNAPEVISGPAPIPLSATPIASPVVDTGPIPAPVAAAVPIAATTPVADTPPAPIVAGPAGQGRPATEVSPETAVEGKQQVALPRTGSAVDRMVLWGGFALLVGGLCLLAGRRGPQAVTTS